MSDGEFETPFPLERLALALSALLGVAFIYLATRWEVHKFRALLAEAVGTALLTAALIDVIFNYVRSKARSKDRETINELKAGIAHMKQWSESSRTQRLDENVDKLRDDVKQLTSRLDAVLGGLP